MFYFLVRDVLGGFTESWLLWFGLTFMAVMLFQPEGIAGIWQRYKPQRLKMKPTPTPPMATAVIENGDAR
jgi:branched-chain amino acid transport system permease protein